MMRRIFAFVFLFALASCGAYSFTGGDVGEAKTISVQFFPNYAELVQPEFSQTFTEKLRDIFIQQTPLELVDRNGDLQFEGSIIEYAINPINVQAGNAVNVAQSRLTVTVNVIYTNQLEPSKSFEQNFNRFVDFDASADFNAVQGELNEQVSQELAENILNQAIGNW